MPRYSLAAPALALLVAPARAGTATYTLTFAALAADAGSTTALAALAMGPFTVYLYDFETVGPGDAGYAGSIGVVPTGVPGMLIAAPGYPYAGPTIVSIAATFAPLAGPALYWTTQSVYDGIAGPPSWAWTGTLAGPTTESFAPNYDYAPAGIQLAAGNTSQAQLLGLSVTIDVPPPAAPEPGTAVPAAIALGVAAAALARRRPPRAA